MACVLVATEADEGLGHILPWQAFARQCVLSGHHLHVAAPNVGLLHACLGEHAGVVWQSPKLRPIALGGQRSPKSWPELLVSLGYADPDQLTGVVRAWCAILQHARPEVVFADYAPALLLACHVKRIPALEVGTGFCVPPVHPQVVQFPGMTDLECATVLEASHKVAKAASACMVRLGVGTTLESVSDLHGLATERIVLSPPRYDHYGERSDVSYGGFRSPANVPSQLMRRETDEGVGVQVIGYLKNSEPELAEIARQLNALDLSARIFAPHLVSDGMQVIGNVSFTRELIDLDARLPKTAFYLSNGGFAGVTEALVAGCWPVVVPQQAEQVALGRLLVQADAGSLWLPLRTHSRMDVVRIIFSARHRRSRVEVDERNAERFLLAAIQRVVQAGISYPTGNRAGATGDVTKLPFGL